MGSSNDGIWDGITYAEITDQDGGSPVFVEWPGTNDHLFLMADGLMEGECIVQESASSSWERIRVFKNDGICECNGEIICPKCVKMRAGIKEWHNTYIGDCNGCGKKLYGLDADMYDENWCVQCGIPTVDDEKNNKIIEEMRAACWEGARNEIKGWFAPGHWGEILTFGAVMLCLMYLLMFIGG